MNNEQNCKKHVENGVFESITNCLDALYGVKGGKRKRTSRAHKRTSRAHKRTAHKRHTAHKRRAHKRRTTHKRRL